MKRILLVVFLSFLSFSGFSQEKSNTIISLYAGGGCATSNNYDVAPSVGFNFLKGIFHRAFFGADVFYQTYALYYDNEQNSAKHGTGNAGVILRHASSFAFVTPKFEYGFGHTQCLKAYLSFGVGFKTGGFDSLRKWDHSYGTSSVNNYDSTLDLSKNINSMLFRVGVGFKEYLHLGHHWWFTFTEDFGFLPSGLTKTGDPDAPARTQYSPQKLNPGYISLQIGITHTRFP
ncbi:MAG: hypothetical protein ACHQD8_04745 [Chitinophagales bacterium]